MEIQDPLWFQKSHCASDFQSIRHQVSQEWNLKYLFRADRDGDSM